MDLAHIIALIIWAIIFVIMATFVYKNKDGVFEALKGSDNKWSTEELAVVMWFILIPPLIFLDVVFNMELSEKAWYSLDAIGVIVLGVKAYLDTHEKK